MARKLTLDEVKYKEHQLFGERYTILSNNYVNARAKLTIKCNVCGNIFETSIDNHLNKRCGCPRCAGNKNKTTSEFVNELKRIYGEAYDYSKVEYVNKNTLVELFCKKHNVWFKKTPTKLLIGQGCQICGLERSRNAKTLTTEEFIEKARKIHGDKYDYSKVEYVRSNKKVCIICPKHGEFWQTPNKHLEGENCPSCKSSMLEETTRNILVECNVDFVQNAKFSWLGKMHLDFYLPQYNIGVECQGEQHFKPVDFGGKGKEWAESEFEKNIKRDELKKKLCEENNVFLIYISRINNDMNLLKTKLNEYEDKFE